MACSTYTYSMLQDVESVAAEMNESLSSAKVEEREKHEKE